MHMHDIKEIKLKNYALQVEDEDYFNDIDLLHLFHIDTKELDHDENLLMLMKLIGMLLLY
ncbi:hypothetical protein IKO18_06895 [bacterium]|nr:hypothetical protein [bacterium]